MDNETTGVGFYLLPKDLFVSFLAQLEPHILLTVCNKVSRRLRTYILALDWKLLLQRHLSHFRNALMNLNDAAFSPYNSYCELAKHRLYVYCIPKMIPCEALLRARKSDSENCHPQDENNPVHYTAEMVDEHMKQCLYFGGEVTHSALGLRSLLGCDLMFWDSINVIPPVYDKYVWCVFVVSQHLRHASYIKKTCAEKIYNIEWYGTYKNKDLALNACVDLVYEEAKKAMDDRNDNYAGWSVAFTSGTVRAILEANEEFTTWKEDNPRSVTYRVKRMLLKGYTTQFTSL